MKKAKYTKLDLAYYVLQLACLLAGLAQFFIDTSTDNIFATTITVITCSTVIQYLWRSKATIYFPVSSLAILGLNVTTLLASLIAQTVYLNPLTHLLRAVYITFPVLSAVQLTCILTHWIYCNFKPIQTIRIAIINSIYKPLGLFKDPPISTIWIMGSIGAFIQLIGQAQIGDTGGKALQAMEYFTWMPLTIPFFVNKLGPQYCNARKQYIYIAIYLIVLFVLGIARNVRLLMFQGPMQIVLLYFLYAMQDTRPITARTVKRLFITLLATTILVAGAADLATAMVLARAKRAMSTPMEMITETIDNLTHHERITQYREAFELAAITEFYDEAYIPNPVLARFSETKFHDNMLYLGSNFTEANVSDMLDGLKYKLLIIFPEPVVQYFIPRFKKSDYFFSMGDYYIYQYEGQSHLSSFVTGSIWADVYTFCGPFFPLAVAMLCLISFIALDSLALPGLGFTLSSVAMCSSWTFFVYGLGSESVASKVSFMVRELPQRIVFFILIAWLISILRNLGSRPSDVQRSDAK